MSRYRAGGEGSVVGNGDAPVAIDRVERRYRVGKTRVLAFSEPS